jgi:hypothetical protein
MVASPDEAPVRGSCAGFEVRSKASFATLREGGGVPLHVEEGSVEPSGEVVLTWRRRPDNPFEGQLLADGERFFFWAADAGWFGIDPEAASIVMGASDDALQRELRLLGVPVALCADARGDVSLHAAAVEIDGRAIVLAGPSHYGKTTLAAGFAQAGHRLLSEDMTVCTTRGGPAAYPGPATVRLRSDVVEGVRPTGESFVSAEDQRVRVVLEPRDRGTGDALPLAAILILREASTQPELTSVAAPTAIRDLLALAFRPPGGDATGRAFQRVGDLVAGVPCLELSRPLTMAAMPAVIELVERRVATV